MTQAGILPQPAADAASHLPRHSLLPFVPGKATTLTRCRKTSCPRLNKQVAMGPSTHDPQPQGRIVV